MMKSIVKERETSEGLEAPGGGQTDLTGRDRLVSNVVTSWGGHLVSIVSGFILPRMIDRNLGQEVLGVWDFCWSLLAYFAILQSGMVSSVNPYVAKYRALGDVEGVNRAVSSVYSVLLCIGAIVLGLTVAFTIAVPSLMSGALGPHVSDARWVVSLLGLSLVIQIVNSGFGGVITGCHRWDLHNGIYAGTNLANLVGMVVVLLCGGGLPGLALVNLLAEAVGRTARVAVAYRVCPGLRVRLSSARWSETRSMIAFGGKSFLPNLAQLLQDQTTSILIVAYLGPASLALYSRPRALVNHVKILLIKFSHVLTPTASSLVAMSRHDEVCELMVSASRLSAYIALPMILTLVILGGPILSLWMGSTYAKGALVLAILAIGQFSLIRQRTLQSILQGLNAHGRPGMANLVAAVCAVFLGFLALGPLQGGLIGTALSIAIPVTIANGIYIPVYACQRLELPFVKYSIDTLYKPMLFCVPFVACLLGSRLLFPTQVGRCILSAFLSGGLTLGVLYWRYVFTPPLKQSITRGVLMAVRRFSTSGSRQA